MARRLDVNDSVNEFEPAEVNGQNHDPSIQNHDPGIQDNDPNIQDNGPWTRVDHAVAAVPPPKVDRFDEMDAAEIAINDGIDGGPVLDADTDDQSESPSMDMSFESLALPIETDVDPPPRRRRPMAIVLSTVVHAGLLMLLATIGFQTRMPKDQIAITAVTADLAEETMESISIETAPPMDSSPPEPVPTPEQFEAEMSPMGTLPIAVPDLTPTDSFTPPPALASLSSSLSSTGSAAKSLGRLSDSSPAKMEFCGVAGGGNHFVYVLDSSQSIGEGFEQARAELLRSINLLTPKQRFYVVFYDAKTEYMRITDPTRDEPRSVKATEANKLAVARWAMTITQEVGKSGDCRKAMQFALSLRPDVIFLLSDGVFPQSVETMLTEENKVENLFDGVRPISIVHTIGYHSREGEARMKSIAANNGGQYRYVPK